MSWDAKTDYCGLDGSPLKIKSSTENRSGQYLEKAGASGAICATKAYGSIAAPSCDYAIIAAGNVAVQLGGVETVGGHRYALQYVKYENGAAQEPTFTATAQQIEDSSDGTTRKFESVSIPVSPDEAAAMLLSAATLSGSGCELVKCTLILECSVNNHPVNGVPVASDAVEAHATVEIEILQTSTTEPTLAAGTGWDISSPLTCTDPDSDMPTWTATMSKPLAYASGSSS